jgi:hypothetical protein
MTLLMIVGPIADQDLGEPVDLLHNAVDRSVLLATDRDVGQRSREQMAGRPQRLQEPVGDFRGHETSGLSRMTVSHGIDPRFLICFSQ